MIKVLLRSFVDAPLIPKLISMLHGVLEHNVAAERVLSFKLFLRDSLLALGTQIDQSLGWHPVS